MRGLVPKTEIIFNKIANLNCIAEYTLIGGTALAIQTDSRLSEDLDFCKWKIDKNDNPIVNWYEIEKELLAIGNISSKDIIDFNQCDFVLDGVRISFYANNLLKKPLYLKRIPVKGNIFVADIESIGAMKLEVMLRRAKFRDYYDIYTIIKEGASFNKLIDVALKYSRNKLKTRDILSLLANGKSFAKANDSNFKLLQPKYDIDEKGIEDFLIPYIKEYKNSL